MLFWYPAILLAFEATGVINTRDARLMAGDVSETSLMFTEKVGAAFEACAIIAGGGDTSNVIECCRQHVAANAARLRA